MRTQKKIRNTLLCVLTAFTVLMLLTVLPFAETVAFNDTAGDSQRSESTQANTSHEAASSEKAVSSKESASSEEAASSGETVFSEKPVFSEEAISSGEVVSSEGPASSEEPASGGETVSSQGTDAGTPAKTASAVSALQTGEYQYQDSDIVASVTLSDASAIPSDAQLHVVPITEEKSSAKYREVETQVVQNVQDENQKVTGFLAYDIYFMANGTRYEPEDGNATVTIQYKKELFAPAVKQATDEIKVLHLKDTGDGTEVEDVTKSVDVADLGPDRQTESESASSSEIGSAASSNPNSESGSEVGSESDSQASSDAASVPDDADTVEFETGSFSVFVVTGVGSGSASIQTSLTFKKTDESTDTDVSGTYYLYIECGNYDGYGNAYHNTLKLDVSGGIASMSLNGLYDQNGILHSLIDSDQSHQYQAILFQGDSRFTYSDKFAWKQSDETNYKNNWGYVRYEKNDEIAGNYTVTDFPGTVAVTSGSGALAIVATAKTKINFSASGIMSRLSPVLPFGVFANIFHLTGSEVEGCIAADYATIGCITKYGVTKCAFGNTHNNIDHYCSSSANDTITVKKTYIGSTPQTFRFGLFNSDGTKPETDQDGDHYKTLKLPYGGSNSGNVTFNVGSGEAANYTVYELGDGDNSIGVGKTYGGFRLTKAEKGTETTAFNWTSYINRFDSENSGGGSLQQYSSNGHQNRLVVGENVPVTKVIDNNGVFQGYSVWGGKITCNTSQSIVNASSDNPMLGIPGILSDMETLSIDLASAAPTDTVAVNNYTVDQLDSLGNNGLTFTIGDSQWLLININASNRTSFSFPSNSKLTVNKDQITGDFHKAASRIIINVYTKDNSGTCKPYTGMITGTENIGGTLLAPHATVTVDSGAYNGRIVANEVDENVEVHSSATGTTGSNIPWTFVNEEIANYITLPETGGTGGGLFFFGGGALVLLAAAWAAFRLMRRKKGAHAGTGPFQIFSRVLLPRGGPALHRRADGGSG